MDLATLLGLIITFGFIIGAIVTGGSILLFVNIPSILIVVGGSVSVVLMQFTLSQFFGAFKVAMKAFFHKAVDPAELIEQAGVLANVARKEIGNRGGGLVALKVASHYACRTRNSRPGARISEPTRLPRLRAAHSRERPLPGVPDGGRQHSAASRLP